MSNEPPEFNLDGASPDEVAQTKRNKEALRQRKEDLRDVMSTKAGRRFVWGLLGQCRVMGASFHTDIAVMAFNEGMRAIGLPLVGELMEHLPESYALMVDEQRIIK